MPSLGKLRLGALSNMVRRPSHPVVRGSTGVRPKDPAPHPPCRHLRRGCHLTLSSKSSQAAPERTGLNRPQARGPTAERLASIRLPEHPSGPAAPLPGGLKVASHVMEFSRVYSSTKPLPPLEQTLNPLEMTCPPNAKGVVLECSACVFQKKENVTPEDRKGMGLLLMKNGRDLTSLKQVVLAALCFSFKRQFSFFSFQRQCMLDSENTNHKNR